MLSLVPAAVMWGVFLDLMEASVQLLGDTTQQSTDRMARRLQGLLMPRPRPAAVASSRSGRSRRSRWVGGWGLSDRFTHPSTILEGVALGET